MYVQLLEFYLYIGERNENHFIVATQDAELQSKLRDIPGQSFAKNCKCFYYACVRIIAVALWPWQVYVYATGIEKLNSSYVHQELLANNRHSRTLAAKRTVLFELRDCHDRHIVLCLN